MRTPALFSAKKNFGFFDISGVRTDKGEGVELERADIFRTMGRGHFLRFYGRPFISQSHWC